MPKPLERKLKRSGRKAARKKGLKKGKKAYKKFMGRYVYGSEPMQEWRKSHPRKKRKVRRRK